MKRFIAGKCDPENIFSLVDPTGFSESEFEAEAIKALTCLFPQYICGVFSGTFKLDGDRRKPDLALIHRSLTHWYVVEVEVVGHPLDAHVLPQVRSFRFGEPEESCVTSLARGFDQIDLTRARQIVDHLPRFVAVISNIVLPEWSQALKALDTQLLALSVFQDRKGVRGHEIFGTFLPRKESMGFATYSAIDQSLRIGKNCGLPEGEIQITDQFGQAGAWTVRRQDNVLWISKNHGIPLLNHGSYVQFIRSMDGIISIKPSPT